MPIYDRQSQQTPSKSEYITQEKEKRTENGAITNDSSTIQAMCSKQSAETHAKRRNLLINLGIHVIKNGSGSIKGSC